ncbi:hypothetical protein Tco_0534425 [Tanacetum coccineum]
MLDSEDSIVTYTAVSSPFDCLSDIGSSRVNGPPMMPEDPYAYVVTAFQAPPSPDYVLGPKEPKQASLSLEFFPEPVYPKFMPPKDKVFPTEEQPLPATVSPTADSPGYITDFSLEEDPEEGPTKYPANGGDIFNDDDESSDVTTKLDNQSIERDHLIGNGFVLDFMEFISFTFGDKEMILVIEAMSVIIERCDGFPLSKGDDTFWFGSKTVGMDESLWSYLLSGAIDGSEVNEIIQNPKWELESSCFTFDLVPLVVRSVCIAWNQVGNEPILALQKGAEEFVVYYDARNKDLEACLEKKEKVIACTSRQLKVLMKDCMTNVVGGLNMRQSRWMKLFSECGFEVKYHLGKANAVVESWSRKKKVKPRMSSGLTYDDPS